MQAAMLEVNFKTETKSFVIAIQSSKLKGVQTFLNFCLFCLCVRRHLVDIGNQVGRWYNNINQKLNIQSVLADMLLDL
jgi:hypothetical protein